MRIFAALGLACLVMSAPAVAQERGTLGNGRLFTNDQLGDTHDRWRTGSYVFSHVRGPIGVDPTAQPFGEILEFRLRAEILAPQRGEDGRPYVGALSAGLHTHFAHGSAMFSLGVDVTAVGEQTGLSQFQEAFHRALSMPRPPTASEVPNEVYLSGTAAVTRDYRISDVVSVRPFVSAQTGVEDLLRAGVDVLIGPVGQGDLWLRDVVTGQLYRGVSSGATGVSYLIGADVAAVESSAFLPADQGYVVAETRTRARAGVHWQPAPDISLFYGVTYLSEEFEGQPEGQVLGSLKLNFNF